jgi:limonene-1,2-epoxide hydrolase
LAARIKTIINNVDGFEILDTFARGPMVVNERMDRFSKFQLKSWHGVGVFFLKDGKIVEWYDYTIAAERA